MNIMTICLFSRVFLSSVLLVWPVSVAAADYFKSATQYYDGGELKAAVIELKNLISEEPKHAAGRLLLGRIYLKQASPAAAEVELDKARRMGAEPDQVFVLLAQSYIRQGKFEAVLGVAKAAFFEEEEIRSEMALLESYAYLGLGRVDSAAQSFARVGSKTYRSKALLGLVRVHFKKNEFDKAFAVVEKVIGSGEEQVDALLLRGALNFAMKDLARAEADYTQLLELEPGHIGALLARAETYLMQASLDKAAADVAIVFEKVPGQRNATALQSRIEFQRNDFEPALKNAQAILNVNPYHLSSLFIVATIKFSEKDFLLAEDYLKRYLQRAGDVFVARRLLGAIYIGQQRSQEAIEVLEDLVNPEGENDPVLHSLLGNAYAMQKRDAESLAALNKAVTLAPDNAKFRDQLALAYLLQGKSNAAIGQLEGSASNSDSVVGKRLLILSYIQAQQFKQAHARIDNATHSDSENPLYPYLKGLAYKRASDRDASLKAFGQALALKSDYGPALVEIGKHALSKGDDIAARDYFLKILDSAPKHLEAMLALAGIEDKAKRPEKTLQWLEKALRENPKAEQPAVLLVTHYLRNQESAKALNVARQFSRDAPTSRVGMSLLAKAQLAIGESAAAQQTLASLIQQAPDDIAHRYLLAGLLAEGKSYAQALTLLGEVVELKPDFEAAWVARVKLLIAQKDYSGARSSLDEFNKRFSESNAMEAMHGDLYAAQGVWDKAIEKYLVQYGHAPNLTHLMKLSEAYQLQGELLKSQALFRQHVSDFPRELRARLKFAGILYEQGVFDEARDQYQRILEQSPDNLIALNNLAVLLQDSNPEQAIGYAETAYQLSAQNFAVADTLGWLYVRNGQVADGLSLIQFAFEKMPDNLQIRYHLGAALQKAGQSDEARFILARLLAHEQSKELDEIDAVKALLAQLNESLN